MNGGTVIEIGVYKTPFLTPSYTRLTPACTDSCCGRICGSRSATFGGCSTGRSSRAGRGSRYSQTMVVVLVVVVHLVGRGWKRGHCRNDIVAGPCLSVVADEVGGEEGRLVKFLLYVHTSWFSGPFPSRPPSTTSCSSLSARLVTSSAWCPSPHSSLCRGWSCCFPSPSSSSRACSPPSSRRQRPRSVRELGGARAKEREREGGGKECVCVCVCVYTRVLCL